MKQVVREEKRICDVCKVKESYSHNACLGCGKDICWECRDTRGFGVEYKHGVHVGGSGDGCYCQECDARLTAEGTDQLHIAYRVIKALREEEVKWYANFNARREVAETNLKAIQGGRHA